MNSRVQIGFWVSGGGQRGLGHVIRSLAIAAHLRSNCNAQVAFQSNSDLVVRRLIEDAGFSLDAADLASHADNATTGPSVWMVDVDEHGPEIVGGIRRRWPGVKVLAMDQSDFGSDCADTVINLQNFTPKGDIPPAWVKYREGLKYAVIREEFKPYRDQPKADARFGDVLISFGSSDIGNNSQMVLAGAGLANVPSATYHVVIGPNVLHQDAVRRQADQSNLSVQVHEQPPNLPELMAQCNLAFCGGGTTMLELAYLGVPAVGIGQTGLEERLAQLLQTQGATVSAGQAGTCQPQDIAALLASLGSQPQRLQGMEQNGRLTVDGKGIERISSLLLGDEEAF